jgi:hypothetical protein
MRSADLNFTDRQESRVPSTVQLGAGCPTMSRPLNVDSIGPGDSLPSTALMTRRVPLDKREGVVKQHFSVALLGAPRDCQSG